MSDNIFNRVLKRIEFFLWFIMINSRHLIGINRQFFDDERFKSRQLELREEPGQES